MSARPRLRSEAGYSIIELLVSSAIMITITGAIFSLVNPSQGTSQVVPEISDLQQRMRVGTDVIFKELLMAGAGPYQGPVRGSLINFFAPILPRRTGHIAPDPWNQFKSDAVTTTYIPNTYSQTTIYPKSMPPNSNELKVADQPNCPNGEQLCGFKEGMDVIIFDTSGHFDTFVITKVQDSAGHLQHQGVDLSHEYAVGASVTIVESNSYYLDRNTNQLMQDSGLTVTPLVDNVVDLRFDYFGDPTPPTTPKPELGTANCLYDAAGNMTVLPTLTATEGSLAPLPKAILEDGPWCGSGGNTFDVDLMRVRKLRVTMRMQVATASLRGANALLFRKPGSALESARQVPDYTVTFEVTPRNLNLTR
jgi:hypothetical protein